MFIIVHIKIKMLLRDKGGNCASLVIHLFTLTFAAVEMALVYTFAAGQGLKGKTPSFGPHLQLYVFPFY